MFEAEMQHLKSTGQKTEELLMETRDELALAKQEIKLMQQNQISPVVSLKIKFIIGENTFKIKQLDAIHNVDEKMTSYVKHQAG